MLNETVYKFMQHLGFLNTFNNARDVFMLTFKLKVDTSSNFFKMGKQLP